jgi:tetratricopeptide (TPR) repeat protein
MRSVWLSAASVVVVGTGLAMAAPLLLSQEGQKPKQQQSKEPELKRKSEKPAPEVVQEEPAEEDASFIKKEYAFNPLQAIKELKTGNFYYKKGSYKAAAGRFLEATHWNPGLTEAWSRLAEASEKLKDEKTAREAWTKYLELEPGAKNAEAIRKKIGAASGSGTGATAGK